MHDYKVAASNAPRNNADLDSVTGGILFDQGAQQLTAKDKSSHIALLLPAVRSAREA
jgi:hypothetical protein